MAGWGRLVRELGQSWLDVLRAELQALEDDFSRSGRAFSRGAGLIGVAVALGFWAIGALVVAGIAAIAIWLPLWASALIVAALFAGIAAGLAAIGKRSFAEVENPISVIRRRLEDHMDWVQSRLLARAAEAADTPDEGARGARRRAPEANDVFPDDFEEELP